MGGVIRFVFALIWIALLLGATGHIIEATLITKNLAEDSYRSKGVSARWWNEQLRQPKKK